MSVFTRIAAIALIAAATPAFAYIGPGSGISLLGGIWSVLVGIVLALAAILFWPIRLMIKRMRRRKNEETVDETPAASGDSD
jgi:membrane protein implicated in regulation of membrane protease activity